MANSPRSQAARRTGKTAPGRHDRILQGGLMQVGPGMQARPASVVPERQPGFGCVKTAAPRQPATSRRRTMAPLNSRGPHRGTEASRESAGRRGFSTGARDHTPGGAATRRPSVENHGTPRYRAFGDPSRPPQSPCVIDTGIAQVTARIFERTCKYLSVRDDDGRGGLSVATVWWLCWPGRGRVSRKRRPTGRTCSRCCEPSQYTVDAWGPARSCAAD